MSKTEILKAIAHLTPAERAEVRTRLDELAGNAWRDDGELSEADKEALDAELAAYKASPDEGSPWEVVKARVLAKLRS